MDMEGPTRPVIPDELQDLYAALQLAYRDANCPLQFFHPMNDLGARLASGEQGDIGASIINLTLEIENHV